MYPTLKTAGRLKCFSRLDLPSLDSGQISRSHTGRILDISVIINRYPSSIKNKLCSDAGAKMSRIQTYLSVWVFFLLVWGPMEADAQERFIDNGDGTVTDTQLNLMWAQADNQADILWEQVPAWIKNNLVEQIGTRYTDWRLPTINELKSLYLESPSYEGYETNCGHIVKMVPEISISCILIWSSDTALGLPLAFNFYLGNPFTVDMTEKNGCRVLPVRRID